MQQRHPQNASCLWNSSGAATPAMCASVGTWMPGLFAPGPPTPSGVVPLLVASLALNVVLIYCLLCRQSKPLSIRHTSATALDTADAQRKLRRAKRGGGAARPAIGSLTGAVDDLKQLRDEYRFLVAGDLLDELRAAIKTSKMGGGWGSWGAADAQKQLDALLADGELEQRIKTARGAVRDLSSSDGFELVQEDDKMKVSQRFTDDRMLTVKIEAVIDGVRPADCLMIWREAALYPCWFPFVTGGQTLAELSHGEVIIHILVETFFMSVDMVLWGWGCDNLAESGEFLMCVRPVNSAAAMPAGARYPPPGGGSSSTLLGALRAKAVIDILVEPLSDNSVRFAFQMSDRIAAFVPMWAINYVVQNAMVNVFDRMRDVAARMAAKDTQCEHYAHVNTRAYAPTKQWIEKRLRGSR